VPEFLAEVYVSDRSSASSVPGTDEVRRAAEILATDTAPVRLIRQIHVPEEETCFYLFEAPSEGLVLEVAARSGLRIDNVVGAVSGRFAPLPSRALRNRPKVRVSSIQEES
jgi:hypothetical protein